MSQILSEKTCIGHLFSRKEVSDLNLIFIKLLDLKYAVLFLSMSESSLLYRLFLFFLIFTSDRVLPPSKEAVVLNFCNWTCA